MDVAARPRGALSLLVSRRPILERTDWAAGAELTQWQRGRIRLDPYPRGKPTTSLGGTRGAHRVADWQPVLGRGSEPEAYTGEDRLGCGGRAGAAAQRENRSRPITLRQAEYSHGRNRESAHRVAN
ncbi:hypothetical protein NDU88_005684 [Pleurodeles waltl]|uniref:Uncharacterized protein n=1 Tax=Pleurodeles waltl TaxID=8319 RepID=A0AAV7SME5_PLEWA|nr:hypothetical protein NDU88_005684 [Pleurodeles waltl]